MTVLWFVIWLVANNVGGHEPLIVNPVNAWAATLILAIALDLSRAGGNAGHFKDPAPGQGIADALRQAERLAATITAGLGDGTLDRRLAEWWRWRDRDAVPRHTWAHTFGSAGPPPHVLIQAQRDILSRPDGAERFWGPSMQRISPAQVLGPATMLRAALHGVARGRFSPRQAVGDLVS